MSTRELIRATRVSKSFGGVRAVRDVSVSIFEGEVLALVGANGAGKSTLFNLIAGAFNVTSGTIRAFGRDVTSAPDYEMCRLGLARTFQVVRPLQGMTARENVMVGALAKTRSVSLASRIADEVLDRVGLRPFRDVPARSLTLSSRKRLEVARALATRPQVLLLDEMMAGLNLAELDRFLDVLRQINRDGVTLVVVEHVMRAVTQLAERVYVMDQGAVIAEGAVADVLRDPKVIAAYLGEGYAAS